MMEWLSNPTVAGVLGGIAGAIVTGIFSVIIWIKSRTRKRVRAVIRDVTSLLEISDSIKSKLDLKVDGKPVTSLFLTSVDVQNVGNAAVDDQGIIISLSSGSEIVGYSVATEPLLGFDGVAHSSESNVLTVKAPLMNVGDRLVCEIISTGNKDAAVDISLRNKDVEEEVVDATSGDFGLSSLLSDRNLLFLAVVSTIPFFGGFARSMINVGVANRIDNLSRRRL